MITGFNTDIEYEGVVYHVQTEDKGLDSPVILSLVYAGGAILASKRSPYEDLIREGFSDEALAERLKRQHRLICAAIHTGRLNDLRRMSGRDVEDTSEAPAAVAEPSDEIERTLPEEFEPATTQDSQPFEEFEPATTQEYQPQPPSEEFEPASTQEYQPQPPAEEFEPAADQEYASQPPPETPVEPPEEIVTKKPKRAGVGAYRIAKEKPVLPDTSTGAGQGLMVRLLDEVEFYAGDAPTLRVFVTSREGQQEDPVSNAAVSVKVLGTTFRPLIYTLKTQRDGIAKIATQIPQFTSGRAAVLVRATVKDESAEVRCIIHPKK